MKDVRLPTLFEIIIVLGVFLALVLSFTVFLDLPIQLALFVSWFIAMLLGIRLGYSYKDLQNAIVHGISNGLEAVLILVSVGALIGTWIAGGVVPTLIYYGLEFIHPSIFLLATLIICSIMSVATGTSWGTVGTAGIAMIAIGEGLGIPLPLVAGAILSGAYFGDKLSPLSDSTVLASSLSKVDVLAHVRAMLYLSIPAYVITAILFTVVGFMYGGKNIDLDKVEFLKSSLQNTFDIHIWMLIPAVLVIVLLAMKKPSMPVIVIGALLGAIWAVVFQGMDIAHAIATAYNGFSIKTDVEFLNGLLNRGGIVGMLDSLVVIIFGLGFGGLLEKLGVLKVIVSTFEKKLTSAGNVTLSTLIVAFLANIFGCAMYVSLILTPKIMEDSYDRLHLDRRVLSRNSEVGGTLTSGMVPWSDNGIYMAGILGVSTFSYLPFMWLSFVAIGLAIIYGYTGKFIWYTKNNTVKAEKLG
ncbi:MULTISPECIES: malate-H+/Na+-lactate antiporter MleN [Bacillaceae]|uniref:Malate-2H(+)/Na(+)-lactate antiporter n=7 Tax=Bacilli TaxID=91061 RepID=MLEN_BACSU|nr:MULTISPECIES: malate-H+/Na+-lactate antiporter MleN [Bacillales]NP_390237.1 malate-H+/Na+-lactate antiporter [Bacillus subtilis subsp. subtilis str. 168]P54571.1 RecName: Full=Malate-2H(+)/Na(+)-lactate antiporter [Bacillus subtilis subsp. subtilis str. 168]AOL30110.1 Na+/H+ antiporter NhaC [Alkalicoccobacillus gibsonii]MDP4100766.1 malate-H+/Na+-lactate antiporter MleN [Bacillota bacterium]CJR81623.1 Malate-2H(+)/Na(+)-lactate antiporter [Streptococcus pneumoniae]BAM52840.1 malate-H+/Na+-